MYFLIKENIDVIKKAKAAKYDNYSFRIDKWDEIMLSLARLERIPFLKKIIERLFIKYPSLRDFDRTTFYLETADEFNDVQTKLINIMESVIEFCNEAGFDEDNIGFDVKMPPTKDTDKFLEYFKDLNFVLTQCPYLNTENEKIELHKTDSGSIWLEFFVIATGSTVLLYNLAKIVDMCIKINSHYITCEQQKEMLKKSELETKALNTCVEAMDTVVKVSTERCVKQLKLDIGEFNNAEDDVRLDKSINVLCRLMREGMEIVASINSPSEIKDIFPTSDELYLPTAPKELKSTTE